MKKIEIEITRNQEKFLKEFAKKQQRGARDNISAIDPIHCVQQKRYYYFNYTAGIDDFLDEEEYKIVFALYEDDDTEMEFDTAKKLVEYFYRYIEFDKTIIDFDDDIFVNYEHYFKYYDIPQKYYQVTLEVPYWEDTAFFWILDEAKKYLQYQKHNLIEPRISTKSGGHENHGSYIHFRNLLMDIGVKLNQEE